MSQKNTGGGGGSHHVGLVPVVPAAPVCTCHKRVTCVSHVTHALVISQREHGRQRLRSREAAVPDHTCHDVSKALQFFTAGSGGVTHCFITLEGDGPTLTTRPTCELKPTFGSKVVCCGHLMNTSTTPVSLMKCTCAGCY